MPPILDTDGDSMITDDTPSPTPAAASSLHATGALSPPSPSGPICNYGSRLAFTYFLSPAPHPDTLNAEVPVWPVAGTATPGGSGPREVHWFTVDDQLLYLSFFMDSGPLNAACL